ncbi:DUF4870 domain-containing protein [Luedemannella flava]
MTEPPLTPPPPPPPAAGPPPIGYSSNDEKTWVLVSHFGGAAGALIGTGGGGWIAPLIALLAKGNESPTVRAHAVAALNFQVPLAIAAVIGWITVCIGIGFIIWIAAMIVGIIFGVLAGLKANEGQFYKYPFSLPLVK